MLQPVDYLFDVKGDATNCILLIKQNEFQDLRLGLPVYIQYYVTHNLATSQMTFRVLVDTQKTNVLTVKQQIDFENEVEPEEPV